ncbi:MAG: alpha/beta hydrolase fold domain-containing protein [Actinomycetaceae bacterium]|nr:alpha/beta hydrolase fold domain-containing protein [Actinomycetaceae bacterium]
MSRKINVPALWSEQMGAAVAKQQELAANAYSTDQSIEQMRQAYERERAFWNEGGPRPADVRDDAVDTVHGPVPVRVYRPTDAAQLPVIVYVHGGGWVLGGLDTHDRITRTLACESGAAVVAVDYTLAPEARFPQALEECAALVEAIAANPGRWGAEPDNISIAGDSGGASIALGAFLMLRDAGKAASIASLLLFYGSYGLRDSASMRLLGGPWDGLTERDLAWYRSQYLRDEADAAHPYVDLLKGDFTYDVPPCYLVSAALDPLKDDSAALATVLNLSGVDVVHDEVDGVIHGFLHHGRILDAARQTLSDAAAFHRRHAGVRGRTTH